MASLTTRADQVAAHALLGLLGIRYQTRFTTGPHPNAVGLFGDAGEAATWPIDPSPEAFTAAARRCGFTVTSPPRSVRIVSPPVS